MPAIGAGIELNNEKAFKDAVRSIGTELKALDAEMKLLQTTFEDNDDSVEALTATGKKLEEQIDAEKRKIDVLRAALEHATSAKNQDADSVNDWSAICWADGEIYKAKDYKGLEIMDRVGGGDSFASGLIYGLMTTGDAELAVNYGAAHGALAMTTPGDTTMASKKEVEAIMGGAGARVQR